MDHDKGNELLQRPLYVFNLPKDLLNGLSLKGDEGAPISRTEPESEQASPSTFVKDNRPSTSCQLCTQTFPDVVGQRIHIRSDLHRYNLKQRERGLDPVDETQFAALIEELNESISGSDTDEDGEGDDWGEGPLKALLKRQAHPVPSEEDELETERTARFKGPLAWFSSPKLPPHTYLGIYHALFPSDTPGTLLSALRLDQRPPQSADFAIEDAPHYVLLMIGGGHFAGMVVSAAPNAAKSSAPGTPPAPLIFAHKTFHRYTTRRKQGGAQSANDAAKGAAHSAGAALRRYNETALTAEIRALMVEWSGYVDQAAGIFVRATGAANRAALFGLHEGGLTKGNPRIKGFPFTTRRPTKGELMRAWRELTRAKVSRVDEAALAAAEAAADKPALAPKPEKPKPEKPSKAEEEAIAHTTHIQSLIKRSKAPALAKYMAAQGLSPEFQFAPASQNGHAPTPLHFAAVTGVPTVVSVLLTKMGADPGVRNVQGKAPGDLAADRATRDAFRVARGIVGEGKDWVGVGAAMGAEEAKEREDRERGEKEEEKRKEGERRKAEADRVREEGRKEEEAKREKRMGKGKTVGAVPEQSGAERREAEMRGLTPEMRARLERERRARAAEERMRRLQGGG
ncbi:hypothetical protein EJ06DRAFT_556357 [Trichodelitschia bisporula]|uniref:VLRF1 domain-containing protein n=1 Tax=Trichodelitschia bisporula TaxID=703511 RepID=A0A6G1HYG6_9PEZI|nr:hypothetical protein EJ06DRAFT_556357 [Trichodelitschia bisporula]